MLFNNYIINNKKLYPFFKISAEELNFVLLKKNFRECRKDFRLGKNWLLISLVLFKEIL